MATGPRRCIVTLTGDKYAAHSWHAGDSGRRHIDLRRSDQTGHVLTIDDDPAEVELEDRGIRDGGDAVLIVDRERLAPHLPGDGPIHGAGIDIGPVQRVCNGTGHRSLARARGSVDCKNLGHRRTGLERALGGASTARCRALSSSRESSRAAPSLRPRTLSGPNRVRHNLTTG